MSRADHRAACAPCWAVRVRHPLTGEVRTRAVKFAEEEAHDLRDRLRAVGLDAHVVRRFA